MAARVVVLDYGSGNVRSAVRALERVGASVELTADPAAVLAADGLMVPGLFARVRLATGKPYSALLVPDRAVRSDEGQKFLFVVNEQNAVERRPVKLGPAHGDLRVVREGLGRDDRVVIGELQRLRPGMTVKPQAVAPGDLDKER